MTYTFKTVDGKTYIFGGDLSQKLLEAKFEVSFRCDYGYDCDMYCPTDKERQECEALEQLQYLISVQNGLI